MGKSFVGKPKPLGADHKVVVVLDHGPRFGIDASEKLPIHVKELAGNKQKFVATIEKSVWSLAVECALEMHRIVSDVFPNNNKLMRFVLSDCVGRFLTSDTSDVMKQWGDSLISRNELHESIKSAGKPLTSEDSSILNGVRMAVDALSQKTNAYRKAIDTAQKMGNRPGQGKRPRVPIPMRGGNLEANKQKRDQFLQTFIPNRGAIVLMTSLKSEEELKSLEADIVEIADDTELVKIQLLSTVDTGEAIQMVVHAVTLDLYNLVSTTITGIPMKEESITGQSVNYDVELFHPKIVLGELQKHKLLEPSSHLVINKGVYSTIKLQWATPNPKTRWDLFPFTSHSSRVSLAEPNSRQSTCLSSYLMNGRNKVMLEVSRQGAAESLTPNVGPKLISQVVMAAGGNKMNIQQVIISKQNNEDLQKKASMKPIPGVRVNDFKSLMKETTLSVKTIEKKMDKEKMPSTSAKNDQPTLLLKRLTRFWPVQQDQTVIYNLQEKFERFFSILAKRELSAEDFDMARGVILEFVARKSSPPYANDGETGKNAANRTEQFQTVAQELALHLGNYVNHSEQHLELFNQLMQLTFVERSLSLPTNDVTNDAKRECIQSTSQALKWYGNGGTGGASTPTRTSSRSNSPQPKRAYKEKYVWKSGETLKLGPWFQQQEQAKYWSRWQDFEGRILAGDQPAKLYADLDLPPHSNKKTEVPLG
ncbi:unnamed protein product, partial [Mesorhabditis belari]|uniref:Protein asunder n=1 Tax=Mesorhabditis belari TaxID=2138241 RepID=A0AAF3EFE8_9BILA